jgi:DNA-binding NarL/FixJ family response regulator
MAGRVVISLADMEQAPAIADALAAAGFSADVLDDLELLMIPAADEGVLVLVIDDNRRRWLSVVSDIVRSHPHVRPVVLSDIDHPDEIVAAVMAGVAGFCHSDAPVEAIVRTVQCVCEHGVAIPRPLTVGLVAHVRHGRGHRMLTMAGPIDVSDREWETMRLMLQRRSTREIADALFVSVGTVRSHVSALLHKAGAVDRDDLIAMVESNVNVLQPR